MTNTVSRLSAIILAVILAAATFSLYAFQANASIMGPQMGDHNKGSDGDRTEINIDNKANVTTNLNVSAQSGEAEANGGDGDDGGNSSQGTAGNGGNGGNGGRAVSGYAGALGTIYGDVNSTEMYIDPCGCEEDGFTGFFSPSFNWSNDNDSKTLKISVRNRADLNTTLNVSAESGEAEANGGDGDDGGNSSGSHSHNTWMKYLSWMNMGGSAGNGGAGGNGGVAISGDTGSEGHIEGYVNYSILRVNKSSPSDS